MKHLTGHAVTKEKQENLPSKSTAIKFTSRRPCPVLSDILQIVHRTAGLYQSCCE